MADLQSIAKALGGDVCGGSVLIAGLGHTPKDRSLSISFDAHSRDGFIVYSHAGDDIISSKDYVRNLLIAHGFSYLVKDFRGDYVPKPILKPIKKERNESFANHVKLWAQGRVITGTIAQTYLKNRGLDFAPNNANQVLKFIPKLWENNPNVCALGAEIRSMKTGQIIGGSYTPLTAATAKQGKKAYNRRIYGNMAGGAIMLTDFQDCHFENVLGIGEGLETTLSLRSILNAPDLPLWALLSANNFKNFILPSGIKQVFIAADHDKAGNEAAMALALSLNKKGVLAQLVRTKTPKSDLNDLCRGRVIKETSHENKSPLSR